VVRSGNNLTFTGVGSAFNNVINDIAITNYPNTFGSEQLIEESSAYGYSLTVKNTAGFGQGVLIETISTGTNPILTAQSGTADLFRVNADGSIKMGGLINDPQSYVIGINGSGYLSKQAVDSYWTDAGSYTYLTNTSERLSIGNNVDGNPARLYVTSSTDANSYGILASSAASGGTGIQGSASGTTGIGVWGVSTVTSGKGGLFQCNYTGGIGVEGGGTLFDIYAGNSGIIGLYHNNRSTHPSSPSGANVIVYAMGNDLVYSKDSSGNEKILNSVSSGTPASATATGIAGQIKYDSSYIYICTATNTWKRVAITSW
jgi:hypothetical protein